MTSIPKPAPPPKRQPDHDGEGGAVPPEKPPGKEPAPDGQHEADYAENEVDVD